MRRLAAIPRGNNKLSGVASSQVAFPSGVVYGEVVLGRDLFLFGVCIVIWGTTWIAITFQIAEASPALSVAMRFLCAGLLSAVIGSLRGETLRQNSRNHGLLLGMGLSMFSLGYVAVYLAELRVKSALVAVGYSAGPLLNQLGVRLAFGRRADLRLTAAGSVGLLGVLCIYSPEVAGAELSWTVLSGLGFTLLGVISSTVGALFAERLGQLGVPVWPKMAWSMTYGALGAAIAAVVMGGAIRIPSSPSYWVAFAYLTAFGSVIAFACYLTLLDRVGSVRSGYVGVMVPVVALGVSAAFEDLKVGPWTLVGAGLALLGNAAMVRLRERPAIDAGR